MSIDPATGIASGSSPDATLGASSDYQHQGHEPLDDHAYARLVARIQADLAALREHRSQLQPHPGIVPQLAAGPGTLIAVDIDGTILTMDGKVQPRVLAAIARAKNAGTHVVISTGRSVEAALPVVRHVGLEHGWLVCANGAMILRLDPALPSGYEIVTLHTFQPAHAIDALLEAVPDGLIAVERPDTTLWVSKPFPPGELIENEHVTDLETLRSGEVTRVVLRAPGMDLDAFTAAVRGAGLHAVEYSVGWTAWLDVNPPGVTKASALEELAQHLGIDPASTMAIGDGGNDLEMISWACVGVAMGTAPAWLSDLADVRTQSVWHDGAAAVLDAVHA